MIRGHKAASQQALLIAFNSVIRGWAAYYRAVVAKRVFVSCDYRLMSTLTHWAGRRHGHKGLRWVIQKYWRRGATGRLEFSTPAGQRLVHHADMHLQRHVKVRGTAFNTRSLALGHNAAPMRPSPLRRLSRCQS